LFGALISSDAVIGESLERATDPRLKPATLGAALAAAVNDDLPANLDDEALYRHSLAVWASWRSGSPMANGCHDASQLLSPSLPSACPSRPAAMRPAAVRSCKPS
jgi:hypothetical protein